MVPTVASLSDAEVCATIAVCFLASLLVIHHGR